MANPEHVVILSQGPEAVRKWRAEHPNERLDLSQADLRPLRARREELLAMREALAAPERRNDLEKLPQESSLQELDVSHCDLSNADLSYVRLNGATLKGTNFRGANLSLANLGGTTIDSVAFDAANCAGLSIYNAVLRNVTSVSAKFSDSDWRETRASDLQMIGDDLSGARMQNARLGGAKLFDVCLRRADLTSIDLKAAVLLQCDIRGCIFEDAKLENTRFDEPIVDGTVVLGGARTVKGCHISLATLQALRDFGGLSVVQRRMLNSPNDVARLRQQFSGFKLWFHLTSAVVFFAPYVWFLASRYWLASFESDVPETMTIGEALWNYICSGGRQWRSFQPDYYSQASFYTFVIYNVARLLLLWKTKELEAVEETTGLPSDFELTSGTFWRHLYDTMQVFFGLAVLAILHHVYTFLQMSISTK